MAAERIATVAEASRMLHVDSFGPGARRVTLHDSAAVDASAGWSFHAKDARALGEALIKAAEHAAG